MGQIKEEFILTDKFSSAFSRFLQLGEQAVSKMDSLNSSINSLGGDIDYAIGKAATESINAMQNEFLGVIDSIGECNENLGKMSSQAAGVHTQGKNILSTVRNIAVGLGAIKIGQSVLELSDSMAQTSARLNMVNDGMQTTEQLEQMIYQSAQRTRTAFQDTANVVAKLGQNAKDAFSSNAETIQFAENLNKLFVISGASQQEIASASLQLTQALGSGVLRGEELNSVFEAAPNVIQTIADYMGKPIGEIRDMASEGQITADVVKNALLQATDDINQQFGEMPMTYEQAWTEIKNAGVMAFDDILGKVNELLNSDFGQDLLNGIIGGFTLLANIAGQAIDFIVAGATFIQQNWDLLGPIILAVAAAMGVYAIYSAVSSIATAAMTVAQWALNSAFLACPITWIVLAIIALIAVIYLAVAAFNRLSGESVSATGIIMGAFAVVGAFIGNLFVAVINFLIDIFVVLWNFIASFANFFGNVFNDPINSIARLFFDLVDTVLSLLQSLASVIDTIFGSSLSSSVQGWRDSLGGWVDKTFGKGEEIMKKLDSSDMHLGRFEYGSAWDAGYSTGQNVDSAISNFSLTDMLGGLGDLGNTGGATVPTNYGGVPYTDLPAATTPDIDSIGNIGKVDTVGKIDNDVSISDEDLKMLRDLSERQYLANVNITIPQTSVSVNQNVNGGKASDMNAIATYLKNLLMEQNASHAS